MRLSTFFKGSLPYLALIIAHLIWGSNFVVAKITLHEIPVMSLAFLRFALSCLLLAPFFLSLEPKKSKIKLKDLPKLFALGLFMITFSIALFYEGLNRTSAINASVLALVVPVLSVLAGWMFLKEKIYWINLLGTGVGLLGAVVILGLPLILFGSFKGDTLVGDLLIVLSGITFVIGTIISKDVLAKYPIVVVTGVAFLIGVVTFVIPAANEYLQNPTWVYSVTILGFLGLLFITILSTICAFFLMEWGIKKLDVIKANMFQYIEPAVAATLAVPILGERISFSFIIGTVLIVLGVYWGTLGKAEHHHLHHRHHRT